MSVIMQMKMTSENDVASDVEKHIVNVLSEKIVLYSKNLSGKEPFKCITVSPDAYMSVCPVIQATRRALRLKTLCVGFLP